jgi:hypothetical protein
MYCSLCGKQMDHIRMRCSACHHMTAAYWLNAFSVAMWLLIAAANFIYVVYLLPIWANLMAGLGETLPPPMRIHSNIAQVTMAYGWLVLLLLVALFVVLHWKKVHLPEFLKSGKLLASFTWLVMAGTFAGILAALTLASVWAPEFVWELGNYRARNNHLAALDSIRELKAAEAAYKQKNPAVGYTCKLEDLKPFASPIRYQGQGYAGMLFTGGRDGYSFSLEGCSGKPTTAYQIVAVPVLQGTTGRYGYCSDESGATYYSDDGTAKACFSKHMAVY